MSDVQAARLTIPAVATVVAAAIGIADWHSLVALAGVAALAGSLIWLGNWSAERDLAEMKRGVAEVMRNRTPGGFAQTPDGVPQPLSGRRARVTAHPPVAAPPLAPSVPVGAGSPDTAPTGLHRARPW